MKAVLTICIGILLGCGLKAAGPEQLSNVSIADCAVYLWRNGIPVSFVTQSVSSKTNSITVAEKIATLQQQLKELQQSNPSFAEVNRRLSYWKNFAKENPNNTQSVIGYKVERKKVWIDFSKEGRDPVDAIRSAFDNYEQVRSNESVALIPKDSPLLIKKVSLNILNLSPFDAAHEINKILKKEINTNLRFAAGGIAQRYEIMEIFDPTKTVTLNLQDVTFVDLLMRFTESLGSDIVWSIRFVDGEGVLMFSKINHK